MANDDELNFTLKDMTECSQNIRNLSEGCKNMEQVTDKIIRYLYNYFTDKKTGEHYSALIRLFKTHSYHDLDKELQESAQNIMKDIPNLGSVRCLTLFSTLGEEPDWNSRKKSTGHKAIPLASKEVINRIPMISQLVLQFGLDISALLKPNPRILLEKEQKQYNVFHIPEPLGSPYIPAQEMFVEKYGINSVLGFGGILPSGDLFVIIMFTKVRITKDTANLFKTLALSVKLALLPFSDGPFFNCSNEAI